MTAITKTIELSNGIRLPFLEQGDSSGIPVVFLHGVTDSMHSFDLVLPHLPPAIHAFALTQRGHGDADRPACGYRTRDFASDVARFLDAVGVQRAFIVGHSMGATNAQRFALDRPARTAGLVLAGAFASYQANAGLVEFWESSVSQLRDPIDAAFAREFQASTLAGPIAPQFFELVMRECLKVPASVWRQAFEGVRSVTGAGVRCGLWNQIIEIIGVVEKTPSGFGVLVLMAVDPPEVIRLRQRVRFLCEDATKCRVEA